MQQRQQNLITAVPAPSVTGQDLRAPTTGSAARTGDAAIPASGSSGSSIIPLLNALIGLLTALVQVLSGSGGQTAPTSPSVQSTNSPGQTGSPTVSQAPRSPSAPVTPAPRTVPAAGAVASSGPTTAPASTPSSPQAPATGLTPDQFSWEYLSQSFTSMVLLAFIAAQAAAGGNQLAQQVVDAIKNTAYGFLGAALRLGVQLAEAAAGSQNSPSSSVATPAPGSTPAPGTTPAPAASSSPLSPLPVPGPRSTARTERPANLSPGNFSLEYLGQSMTNMVLLAFIAAQSAATGNSLARQVVQAIDDTAYGFLGAGLRLGVQLARTTANSQSAPPAPQTIPSPRRAPANPELPLLTPLAAPL